MRKTYITKLPDKAGTFLKASQIISSFGGNIVRVNYNKAIDLHTLFIEVSASSENHEKIEEELKKSNYLFDTKENQTDARIVIDISTEHPDYPANTWTFTRGTTLFSATIFREFCVDGKYTTTYESITQSNINGYVSK